MRLLFEEVARQGIAINGHYSHNDCTVVIHIKLNIDVCRKAEKHSLSLLYFRWNKRVTYVNSLFLPIVTLLIKLSSRYSILNSSNDGIPRSHNGILGYSMTLES